MKRKVIVDFGVAGYWQIEDITDYFQEVKEDRGEEEATLYFREGTFSGQEIENVNGEHFIVGFLETISQSDNCPPIFYNESIKQVSIEAVEEKE